MVADVSDAHFARAAREVLLKNRVVNNLGHSVPKVDIADCCKGHTPHTPPATPMRNHELDDARRFAALEYRVAQLEALVHSLTREPHRAGF